MANSAGKTDGREVYEGFEFDDYVVELHGSIDSTELDFPEHATYFHVTKAIAEIVMNGCTHLVEMPGSFIDHLNDFNQDFYKQIIDQIKGA